MNDETDRVRKKSQVDLTMTNHQNNDYKESKMPNYNSLEINHFEASKLVDDIILKNYLEKLTALEIIPLDEDLKNISDIRMFKITEMVYQKNEYSAYKFASVFNAVQNLNCGVFIIVDSSNQKTDFYMGVRSYDTKRTTKSLKDTLKNALNGQFPGVKTIDLLDPQAEKFIANIQSKNIAAVSCVAKNKDEEFKDNEKFIQGLEKFALAMQGQRYTAVLLAKSTPNEQLRETRHAYETIYTQLSPFANMQLSYGTNNALSISEAFSKGMSSGNSNTKSSTFQKGTSFTAGSSINESISKQDSTKMILKGVGNVVLAVGSIVTAPLTGGASLVAAAAFTAGNVAVNSIQPPTKTEAISNSESHAENTSESLGESTSISESTSKNYTDTRGITSSTSDTMQLTMQNKTLINTLERIDLQLKRIEECESLGMWESAAYFLSESQETAEMAAGTYKALMRGDKSGVETSAINYWGKQNPKELPLLREYITNFIHPIFEYRSYLASAPVTASSLISSNELAIQMGLPRKSVCGLPVIEHADFGKEVVKYDRNINKQNFVLGKVFCMGKVNDTEVRLDRDSMTMHTFVTGSTGSGKSNTVYEILNQLRSVHRIPFLVIEPAKGEYKNLFGQYNDVAIYGTNPKKSELLRINPFRFPSDIHVLEHLDRLIEIFNVCWPMYAAMPAILKEAMERAYIEAGWDLRTSENIRSNNFPNFADLLEQIESVINDSKYSDNSKGDYSGALVTRIRSLTNGLNGLIFTDDDLSDRELFDKSVVVDLSRVGSSETKSLIMGLLVLKLNEYRMSTGKMNSSLNHVTVIEEAHNLLRRTSTEQSSESSNLLGKSVELLSNSIAEMRTYGEGFIIADQSPGLLDMSVIRNTNTKIILRLPEQSDRELVGLSASLNKEQIDELSKLERGVAAIYQNDWVEPVLVKVNKCNILEAQYNNFTYKPNIDEQYLRQQIVSLLIQGRVRHELNFDVNEMEINLNKLRLTSRNREFIEDQIAEFNDEGKLALWENENFRKLSRFITDFLNLRSQVENCIMSADSYTKLTEMLTDLIRNSIIVSNNSVAITISHCLMKDYSSGESEPETREFHYKQWITSIKERGVRDEFCTIND